MSEKTKLFLKPDLYEDQHYRGARSYGTHPEFKTTRIPEVGIDGRLFEK